jgi:hypothetical protein
MHIDAGTNSGGDALMILGRADEAIAKHREAAAQELKPLEASSMDEQTLRVADLCQLGEAYRDKRDNAMSASHDQNTTLFHSDAVRERGQRYRSMINFDRVYQDLLAPAVRKAELEPI